jgi:hypothetical protein
MRVSPAFILLFAFFANYGMATAAEDVQAVKGAQVKSLFYDPCLRSVADGKINLQIINNFPPPRSLSQRWIVASAAATFFYSASFYKIYF